MILNQLAQIESLDRRGTHWNSKFEFQRKFEGNFKGNSLNEGTRLPGIVIVSW